MTINFMLLFKGWCSICPKKKKKELVRWLVVERSGIPIHRRRNTNRQQGPRTLDQQDMSVHGVENSRLRRM